MLSELRAGPERGEVPPARWRSAAVALAPSARASRLELVALTVALAAVPTIISVAQDGPTTGPLLIAALTAGSSLAWAADDPAASLLASMPVGTATRTMLRLLCVGAVVIVGLVATIALLATRAELPADRWSRLPEGAAAAGIALAASLSATRRGEQQVAAMGIASGILGTGTIAVLSFRFPDFLPSFLPGPTHDRWWIVAALGFAVAVYAGRDPARR